MTEYAIHDPEPARYSEKHKPGKRVYIAGRITGAPLFKLSFSNRGLHSHFSGI